MSNDPTTTADLGSTLAFDAAQTEANLVRALRDLAAQAETLATDIAHNGLGRESVLSQAIALSQRSADLVGRAGRLAGLDQARHRAREAAEG